MRKKKRRRKGKSELFFFPFFLFLYSRRQPGGKNSLPKKKTILTSERAATPTGAPGPSPAEQEEQPGERHQREQQVAQQRRVVPLRVALRDADVDSRAREDVDEVGVVGQHDERAAAVDGRQLELRAVLGEAHALDLAGVDGIDELRVAPLVALGERAGILERGRSRGGKLAGVGLLDGGGLLLGRGREVEGEGRGRRGEGRERGEARGGEELRKEGVGWLVGKRKKRRGQREEEVSGALSARSDRGGGRCGRARTLRWESRCADRLCGLSRGLLPAWIPTGRR